MAGAVDTPHHATSRAAPRAPEVLTSDAPREAPSTFQDLVLLLLSSPGYAARESASMRAYDGYVGLPGETSCRNGAGRAAELVGARVVGMAQAEQQRLARRRATDQMLEAAWADVERAGITSGGAGAMRLLTATTWVLGAVDAELLRLAARQGPEAVERIEQLGWVIEESAGTFSRKIAVPGAAQQAVEVVEPIEQISWSVEETLFRKMAAPGAAGGETVDVPVRVVNATLFDKDGPLTRIIFKGQLWRTSVFDTAAPVPVPEGARAAALLDQIVGHPHHFPLETLAPRPGQKVGSLLDPNAIADARLGAAIERFPKDKHNPLGGAEVEPRPYPMRPERPVVWDAHTLDLRLESGADLAGAAAIQRLGQLRSQGYTVLSHDGGSQLTLLDADHQVVTSVIFRGVVTDGAARLAALLFEAKRLGLPGVSGLYWR